MQRQNGLAQRHGAFHLYLTAESRCVSREAPSMWEFAFGGRGNAFVQSKASIKSACAISLRC